LSFTPSGINLLSNCFLNFSNFSNFSVFIVLLFFV
jgi:hypothetical protein